MSGLLYISIETIKNRILQLKKKPGMLILYLFIIGLVVVSLVVTVKNSSSQLIFDTDIRWLKLILLGYLFLFLGTSLVSGFSKGSSFFEMNDVNILFVSPTNPKLILVYGIMRQTVKTILVGVFILFVGPSLSLNFGITIGGVLLLFLIYIFAVVSAQVLSVCIYMYTNMHARRKSILKILIGIVLLPFALSMLIPLIQGGDISSIVMESMSGNTLWIIPIAGWCTEMFIGFVNNDLFTIFLALGLNFGFMIIVILFMVLGKSDYYEDVLVATETAFQKKLAASQGDLTTVSDSGKKVRAKGTIDFKRSGGSLFFEKHIFENSRKNKLKIFDYTSLFLIAAGVFMSFTSREASSLLSCMIFILFMRTFTVGTGLGLKELYMHYIYLIPAGSFSKMFWSNMEIVLKGLSESIVMFVIAGIIVKAPISEIILSIVLSTFFVMLLVSINLLSMRIFTEVISQGVTLMLYMLFVILVSAPGAAASILIAVTMPTAFGTILAYCAFILWEILLSVFFFYLSRGVLHSCDMETLPTKK